MRRDYRGEILSNSFFRPFFFDWLISQIEQQTLIRLRQFTMLTEIGFCCCNIMHTQFELFPCCARPHNCAFCCTFPFLPTVSLGTYPSLLHATSNNIFIEQKLHCCSLASALALDVKTSNFYWKPKWNCRTRRVKIQSKVSGYFPSSEIIIMLSKTFWKLLSISLALKGNRSE